MSNVAWWVHSQQGEYGEAEALYAEMLEIRQRISGNEDPQTLRVMRNLASTYSRRGKHKQAESMFIEVLGIQRRVLGEEHPDTATSLNGLAWLWSTCPKTEIRDGTKAVEYATRACELTNWENASNVDTLAAAYAEAGDYDSAIKWQKEAIVLITDNNPVEWRIEFEERLRLYESGKPYREVP